MSDQIDTKFKFSGIFVIEIAFIFSLWLISVLVSSPVFNRPLGNHLESITAHTLVSMRAFEDWGFWKLLGASVLTPKSYEFLNIDITLLSKNEGIYLSYPSFWLILPYTIFKILNLFGQSVSLSIQYLQAYNLVLNRLFLGGIIYYLCLEIVGIISGNFLTEYKKRLIAFLCLIGWMFTPPIMYWTQNVYFSDQAVLLPIYGMFLLSLKCRFNFNNLSQFNKFLLFVASFLACSIDWYGWVSVVVIFSLVFIDRLITVNEYKFSIKSLKEYLNSIKLILFGMLLAGLIFSVQILYYKDGVTQILRIAIQRTAGTTFGDHLNNELSLLSIAYGVIGYWIPYFPPILQRIFSKFIWNPGLRVVDFQYLFSAFIVLSLILILLGTLYYFYKHCESKKVAAYVYILVFATPLLQLSLLKQHSLDHDFSAFKMGLPFTFSFLLLPAVTLFKILESKSNSIIINTRQSVVYISCFVLLLGLVTVVRSRSEFIKFANVSKKANQDMGFLVSRNTSPKDLLIADPISNSLVGIDGPPDELVFGAFPPEPVWYTNRFIHSSKELKDLRTQVNVHDLKRMKPVFLAYEDLLPASSVSSICNGQWQDVGKVEDRKVVICRAEELHRLLD